MYPMPVAQALTNGAKQTGWLSDAKVKAHAKEFEDSLMLVVGKPVSLLMGMMVPSGMAMSDEVKPRAPEEAPRNREKPQRDEEKPKVTETVEKPKELPKELKQLIDKEELLIGRVTRKGERILEEWTLSGMKPLVGGMVQFALEMSLQRRAPATAPPFPEKRLEKDDFPKKD
jgi:hypothetical protein